ncbi:MAG: hypothetical protein WKF75_17720 [Singulisphaera sp.]
MEASTEIRGGQPDKRFSTNPQDNDFLRIDARGEPHAGIAYCQQERRTIGEIIDGLVLIWEVLEPEEASNHVEFV